jgi:hypothetical protein
MTLVEIVQRAHGEGAQLIRYRKESYKQTGTAQYDVKPLFTGSKRGWIMLDIMTASMLLSVYNGLRPDLQAKFNNIPLGKLVDLGWKYTRAA